MTRPPTLTDRQIQIIRENLDLFPADILKLPEFADTDVTRHTIRNYQRRLKNAAVIDEEEDLLTRLKQYMNRYGLESRSTAREESPGSSGTWKPRSIYARLSATIPKTEPRDA